MLLKRLLGFFLQRYRVFLNRRSIVCLWRAGRCAFAGLCLETHQQIGTRDDFPPLFDVFVLGEPEIGPSQFVFALLKSIFNLGAQPINVAKILLKIARHIRHDQPWTLWRLFLVIRGQLVIANSTPLTIHDLAAPSRFGVPMAKNTIKFSPRCISNTLP